MLNILSTFKNNPDNCKHVRAKSESERGLIKIYKTF